MPERRWVLDTNALISRLLLPTGAAARAVDHALARGVVLVSEETMSELAEVISRPKFDRYVSVADRVQFVRLLGGVARMVNITHRVTACRDPKDDKFLHVALNGEAEAIVTGDRDLLVLHPFHGISILSPADFVVMV
ncbi:MAG: putative toxin-antitoxin system toxin component, PIN family [Methyloversatilis sp.]|uniref:putative toxin-antitoxin system toxin component, PIN family n=1 Tax=Methyloversatilis sp. TaxID=2569862 RepID=UPI002732F446|nr:putative toxin-antitoxin system toxin component, PIN family [Methyloversatilis sp.]MDP3873941.1 putative toxin-antitoxin system toxin component, PIN family [Methyloversatilis sp.]